MNAGATYRKLAIQVSPVIKTEEKKAAEARCKLVTENLDFYYRQTRALHGINIQIKEKHITALIALYRPGPMELFRALGSKGRSTLMGKTSMQSPLIRSCCGAKWG